MQDPNQAGNDGARPKAAGDVEDLTPAAEQVLADAATERELSPEEAAAAVTAAMDTLKAPGHEPPAENIITPAGKP